MAAGVRGSTAVGIRPTAITVTHEGSPMGSNSKKGTAKIGRNAGNGRFTKVKTAREKPRTHVVETIRKKK